MSQLPPPGGDEPPVYQWLPDSSVTTTGDSASWLPPPATGASSGAAAAQPDGATPAARAAAKAPRAASSPACFAFLKYGLVLVKFGTFGPTLITMVIAIWFYTLFFGPAFAVGIVVLILIHELGHFLVARWMGLPARLPIFIGPLGAVTNLRRLPGDAGKSGIIALAGPGDRARSPRCCASCSPASRTPATSATCCSRSRISAVSST